MASVLDRFRGRGLAEPWRRLASSVSISRARNIPIRKRLALTAKLAPITWRLFPRGLPPHSDRQLYAFWDQILRRPQVPGVLVEAGAFKGISAAKTSHVAVMTGRRLVVFDSFEGLPDNDEPHVRSTQGFSIEGWFEGGKYAGSLEEVIGNVARFGRPDVVAYVKGWFEDTMPSFTEQIAAAYIDVDLASSTRTCIRYLWPLLSPGGVIVSQDGDFPLVIDVLRDVEFWRSEVGCEPPPMTGIGTSKMVTLFKVADWRPIQLSNNSP